MKDFKITDKHLMDRYEHWEEQYQLVKYGRDLQRAYDAYEELVISKGKGIQASYDEANAYRLAEDAYEQLRLLYDKHRWAYHHVLCATHFEMEELRRFMKRYESEHKEG